MDRYSDDYFELVNDVSKYPDLNIQWEKDQLFVQGDYKFSRKYNGIICTDTFFLRIEISTLFPEELPIVHEIGNKIPKEYHKNSSTALCLGTDVELYQIFYQDKKFSTFMNKILNPYLYRWLYISTYNSEPWKDRPHGNNGIIESYAEILGIDKAPETVLQFLYILANENARINTKCPCGSGKKTKCCHMHILNKLMKYVPNKIFKHDYKNLGGL